MTFSGPAGPSMATRWLMAVRPRTLSLSVTPVVVGAALSWAEAGRLAWPATLAALAGAMLIQIGTNLHNDAADFERGADGADRLGPTRVTAAGLLPAQRVTTGAVGCFAGAALVGLYLAAIGGWPILALGVLSILAGWCYTGGPRPIAYTPFGEVFVLAFFGLGAVGGTYWLNSGTLGWSAVLAGAALGLFAAAVLLVNNHRDVESDAHAGRHTLAMVLGPAGTRAAYAAMLILPCAALPPLGMLLPGAHAWIAWAALPLSLWLGGCFAVQPRGPALNRLLARTAQAQLVFGGLLGLGLVL